MGNILKCFISCFDEEDDDGGRGGHSPNSYPPPSRLHYQPLGLADLLVPLSTPPRPSQQQLWPVPPLAHHHGVHRNTIKIASQRYDFLNLKSTSTLPRQQQQLCPVPPLAHHHGVHRATIKIAAQRDDFLNLKSTSTVCEGHRHHSTSSKKAHLNRCIDEKDNGSGKPYYCLTSRPKDDHGVPTSRPKDDHGHGVPVVTCRTNLSPLAPHGVDALQRDLIKFAATSMVPEGLAQHVTSPKQAQVTWYRKMLAEYEDIKSPPRASADAAMLVVTALRGTQRTNLEGVLAFYGFSTPTIPKDASENHPSSIPEGVLFVLKTLPVNAKRIVDGDGFTAYVNAVDPIEVREDFSARRHAPNSKKQKRANALKTSLQSTGLKEMFFGSQEILARKYEIRLRGVDAPEMGMQYGKESQDALVKLIDRKCVTLHVYGQDQFKRFVCDIYCDSVFIQEQMLVNGHVWHFKTYDKRREFAMWEKWARDARRGLWAHDNPEKPWEWRKNKRKASQHPDSGLSRWTRMSSGYMVI